MNACAEKRHTRRPTMPQMWMPCTKRIPGAFPTKCRNHRTTVAMRQKTYLRIPECLVQRCTSINRVGSSILINACVEYYLPSQGL